MSSATLAIVDDDKPFAEYLQTLLGSRGYNTASYHSGDALLAVRHMRGKIVRNWGWSP